MFNLSEDQVNNYYTFDYKFRDWHDQRMSPFLYFLELIVFILFFSFAFMFLMFFPIGANFIKARDISKDFLKFFNLHSIWKDIIIIFSKISIVYVVIVGILYFFLYLIYIKTNRVKLFSHQNILMLILGFVFYVDFFLLGIYIHPYLKPYSEILQSILILLFFFNIYKGIRGVKDSLLGKDIKDRKFEKLYTKAILLLPLSLVVISIFKIIHKDYLLNIQGFLAYILILFLPYIFILRGEIIVEVLVKSFIKTYYLNKYPEVFRMKNGESKAEFYGPKSKEVIFKGENNVK